MKKLILSIICLSINSLSYTQTDNADAEFLKIEKEYTLNEDGSIDLHYSKQLKILSHYAFHRLYGETFILHNTKFQTLKINSAYTIMADGKKVITPENAFNEVLPRFANNAPAYNHIRELVVTHTALEVGSVIHLDYTIHSKKGFYPALMIDEVLLESSPTKQLDIKVNVPISKSLQFDLLNIDREPVITTEEDKKAYTWTFNNLPANSKDDYQARDHLDTPRLMLSSAENPDELYNQFLNQDTFDFKTNEKMDKLVEKVSAENNDKLSTALAIQKVVSNDLNALSIPLKYSGFVCRSPIKTWDSNQGTKLEKALLLAALLEKANIDADVVAIIPEPLFNKQQGNLLNFNDFAVMLKLDNYGEVLLSADKVDKQNLIFSMEDQILLTLNNRNKNTVLIPAEKAKNKVSIIGDFEISDTGSLTGKLNLALEGNANPYFSLFKDASTIKSVFKGGIHSKDIASFTYVQLSQEMSRTHLQIEKKEPFKDLNTYLSFDLPYAINGVDSWHMNQLTSQRNSSLEIPETIHEQYHYSIELTDDLKPILQATNIEISNEVGHLLIKIEKTGNKLLITREIKITTKLIDLDKYDDFKEIMNVWNNNKYKQILFKKR